jgi:hypothetical protein
MMAHRDFLPAAQRARQFPSPHLPAVGVRAGHSHSAKTPSSRPEPSVARRSGGTSLVVASTRKVPRRRRPLGSSARDDGIFVHMRIPGVGGVRAFSIRCQGDGYVHAPVVRTRTHDETVDDRVDEGPGVDSSHRARPASLLGNLESLIRCSGFPDNFSGFPVSIPCCVVKRTAEEIGQSVEPVGESTSQCPVTQFDDSCLFRSPPCPAEGARRGPPGRKPRHPTAKPVGPTAKQGFCVRGATH